MFRISAPDSEPPKTGPLAAPPETAAPDGLGKPQYLLAGLVAVAMGASLPLIPHGRELALLRLHMGQPERAIELLERRVAEGDHSPSTVATLAHIHAGRGEVDRALALLRMLADERPRDVAALQALAELSRDGADAAEYLDALERLQALAPVADRQREIARLAGLLGQEPRQRAALQALVERFDGVTAADRITLATMQAAAGDPLAAARTLERLAAGDPAAMDLHAAGMQIAALLAAGQADRALQGALDWLAARPDQPDDAALTLAGVLDADGRRDLAHALLQARLHGRPSAPLTAALAQMESDAGRREDALRRVEQAEAAGVVDDELLRLHLRLALATGQLDSARSAADLLGLDNVPADSATRLAGAALAAGRKDLLAHLAQQAGASFLSDEPALAARVHLALGDRAAARRHLDAAAAAAQGDPERLLELAGIELRLGSQARALRSLRRAAMHADAATPALASTLPQMARLYIRMGYAREGHAVLARVRQRRPSPAADEAWALTAAASGQGAKVRDWMAAGGGQALSAGFHADLFHLAMDARSPALAVAVAQRLYAARASDANRLMLANALVASDQPTQALPHLRVLHRKGAVEGDAYAAVLLAAWRRGEPAAEELRGIWSQRLAEAKDAARREAAVQMLFELGAHAQLLPALGAMALERPQRWLGLYTEAATRAGRRADLVALWKRLGERADTPAGLRQQIASRLLEAAERPAAEKILLELAADAPRDAPAVRQLLFVWGPRPQPHQLDWIEARARQAGGEDKARWMRDLLERNGAARAVAAYRASGGAAQAGDAASQAYLDALAATGDRAGLAGAMRATLAQARDAVPPRRLVELAVQTGDATLERQALQRAALAPADDPKTLRTLGLLAFGMRDFGLAERHLGAFAAATGGDYEVRMHLGEIRLKQRDSAGARAQFEQALAAIEASADGSVRARTAQARAMQHLGREAQARTLYEALLAERPHDKSLRADYVSLLMHMGELRQARAALDGQ